MLNNKIDFAPLSLSLALAGAATQLDELAECLGFAPGFSESQFDVDFHDDEQTLTRLLGCLIEDHRLLGEYDAQSCELDWELDTSTHRGCEECCHCGDLFQDFEDHSCYGTRGEAGEARMQYEYECQGWE